MLEVRTLVKHFKKSKNLIEAVNGVSFYVEKGETLGLVGESGCGKSTLGKLIVGLIKPTAGDILFEGKKVKKWQKDLQIIFQDHSSCLNPKLKIKKILSEPIEIHSLEPALIYELMDAVCLPHRYLEKFPHELSGGEKQRIGIARALALNPKFLICDEPISALDASTASQILNLLIRLQKERGLTYLFISHDLIATSKISNRIAVMFKGEIVETLEGEKPLQNATHPYTKKLISSIPKFYHNSGIEKLVSSSV